MHENRGLSKLMRKGKRLRLYLLGFIDAEGCFSVSLKKQKDARFGWVLDPLFQVTQHKNYRIILELMKKEFSCGRIIEKPGQKDLLVFLVDNRRQLKEKVMPFFEKNPLVVKSEDFRLFKEIVEGLENKMHSDKETFKVLIRKAFNMNLRGKQRRHDLKEVLEDLDKQRILRDHTPDS